MIKKYIKYIDVQICLFLLVELSLVLIGWFEINRSYLTLLGYFILGVIFGKLLIYFISSRNSNNVTSNKVDERWGVHIIIFGVINLIGAIFPNTIKYPILVFMTGYLAILSYTFIRYEVTTGIRYTFDSLKNKK